MICSNGLLRREDLSLWENKKYIERIKKIKHKLMKWKTYALFAKSYSNLSTISPPQTAQTPSKILG